MRDVSELVNEFFRGWSNIVGVNRIRLASLIEARDRETVEACGKIVDRFGAMSIRPSMRDVADAVRSLSQTPAEVSRG